MIVGVCRVNLFFPAARSLKDKRRVLKGILDRIRTRINVSAAEIGAQEIWRRGEIAVAAVGNDRATIHSLLMSAIKVAESEPRAEVLQVEVDWL